ncbi:hypothetical protein EOA32_00955 [Mesorhizobium sp. M1A.F.Ca.ET.072.01.1.1]|uniref:hypothetical protein n=1 Tax=Mesorhizobium sp. M1A.F.Ca.ET.072.01.1.1 TaxID=2496753 RepID=UPI000FD57AA4|nr:hypothetical protein [Mesorhizobium sp. M1A.F.Ca.ET.072.01.1.1]RUW55618.1 hypothetical protein EOA32_00955 [Mesorhizobium sp. M1A.F.Ca.ET.072.01.1.1]
MAALTFPYSLANFADLLKIESIKWFMQRNDQIDGLENGQILAAEVAPPLRTGTVNIRGLTYDEDRKISALIEALDGSINAFMLYGPPALYPMADPGGVILGANVVTILSLNANNKQITLTGLPIGYTLSAGDFVQFPFGPGGVLNAYHRIVQGAVANGAGQAEIELRPHVYAGTSTGVTVTLKKPAARVKMIPGSYDSGLVRGQHVEGKKFDVIESFN